MKFSGKTTKRAGPGKSCFKKVILFDVQWSDCPVEIEDEVRKLWQAWELGNDHCIIKWDWHFDCEDYPDGCPQIAAFLRSKGFTEDDEILIHWWW